VPTLNASPVWAQFRDGLISQEVPRDHVLIVDSASDDTTVELARASGFSVVSIARSEFNHGGTRQWATRFFPDAEIFVYLTQDAILADPGAIATLLGAFHDRQVGAAYGRQLPRPEAGPIETHGRLFNYQSSSDTRSLEDRKRLGFKTIFISNSFAAYRRSALDEAGGFPLKTIFGEDTITAARMLLNGWKIAYMANACVYHSHEYSIWQEFKRYFDIGVLHAREPWLAAKFGGVGSEGKRYVISELKYLVGRRALLIPSAVVRTVAKFSGYWMGRREAKLSVGVKSRISMNRGFWD
jgi:GT2 family glycosyltransferase